jgi:Ca2+-binding EF-hand superfamily protein
MFGAIAKGERCIMLRPTPLLALFLGTSAIAAGVQVSGASATSGFVADSQPGQERKAARQRFAEMDANGDGRISREEWRGSAQSFRVHDWNRDGVISGNELRDAVRQAQADALEDFDTVDSLNDWSASRFTALDQNRDGRITRAEWQYDLDSFYRVDRDRNNVLSRAEFLGGDFDDDRGDRFDYLDADGNNRVTRQEWHASADAFNWLDRNRDGVLSRSEVEGNNPTDTGADAFGRLDANGDNRISRSEWRWTRSSFDQRDANGDGVLSRREMVGSSVDGTSDAATVNVATSTTRWIDSGVFVYAGDIVRFQATGTIQMSTDGADVADPGGARSQRRAASAPLPQQPAGALIARIDQGGPIFVGANTSGIRMPQTGRLYLSVNDDHLPDNTGEFRVVVEVQRASTY